jgi:hypothetical protein
MGRNYHCRRQGRFLMGLSLLVTAIAFGIPTSAQAQVTIATSSSGWEFYTTGRVGVFAEVLQGHGIPAVFADVNGHSTRVHPIYAGGIPVDADPDQGLNSTVGSGRGSLLQGRLRSGYVGNILAFGVRGPLTDAVTLRAHISLWATAESDLSYRAAPDGGIRNRGDVREGYLELDSPWGSVIAGRAKSLFSRGAQEINYLYGHGFGVGAPFDSRATDPNTSDTSGPTGGHIGFGVLAPVYVAGITYVTPKVGGFQLSVGYFDPGTLLAEYWTRAKWGRPEAELTFDAQFSERARIHLFVNGAYQKVYNPNDDASATVYGGGAGARLELGPVHLGVAGHKGQGVGTSYFMASDETVVDFSSTQTYKGSKQLRTFDGAYVQSQFVLGEVDLNLGWGITRVYQLTADIDPQYFDPDTKLPAKSVLKSQMGLSAVLVYHFTDYLHGALDYFRAESRWWQGESQVINSFNAGLTVTW